MDTHNENDEIRIARWSGVWRRGNEVRVGVRLDDGRDGMLVASWVTEGVDPDSDATIGYSLLIMGEPVTFEVRVPVALRSAIKKKLATGSQGSTMTLKDLSLF